MSTPETIIPGTIIPETIIPGTIIPGTIIPETIIPISKGTDEILFSMGKNIKEFPDNSISYLGEGLEHIPYIFDYKHRSLTYPENYWSWNNGMKTYLLFLYLLVIFGISVFIFKLIAFTSILSHKGLVNNNPLVKYLTSGIQQGFEEMQYKPKYTFLGIIYSVYLGIVTRFNSLPKSLVNFDNAIIQLKRNIEKDIFQPFLVHYIFPIMNN